MISIQGVVFARYQVVDLDRAAEWFDRLIVVDRRLLADGAPDAVLDSGAYTSIREHTHTHGHARSDA